MKIIKAFEALKDTSTLLPIDDERGICEFRSFYPIACVYSERMRDLYAINVALEIVEDIRKDLQNRKDVLNLG